jgi:hypothetical protein
MVHKDFEVDKNVSVSPLLHEMIAQIADKYEGRVNDERTRQQLYTEVQNALRKCVEIEAETYDK